MSCLRAEPEGCAALKDCTAPNSRHDEIRDRPYVAGSFQLSQQQRWQRERGRLWSAGDQSPAVGLPSSMRCHRWTMSHVSGVAEGSATLAACPCASPLTTCFVERARTPHRLMNILQQTKPANDVSLHCQLDRCAPVIGSCLRKLHGIRHLRNSVLRGHERGVSCCVSLEPNEPLCCTVGRAGLRLCPERHLVAARPATRGCRADMRSRMVSN